MNSECYPLSILPHLSRLFADALALDRTSPPTPDAVERYYPTSLTSNAWMYTQPVGMPIADRAAVTAILERQTRAWLDGVDATATLASIDRLRQGARAVVTGQQVGLFGGPLLTLLKAATAVARAAQATADTGLDHVPVFWLASEDHDLAEVDQATVPARHTLETLGLGLASHGQEVGGLGLGENVTPVMAHLADLLGHAPVADLLARCYVPGATLASAFACLLATLFAPHGLIVMDAGGRDLHALGAPVLSAAVELADELEATLLARTEELESDGYHAQVLVKPGASLLFLLDATTAARNPLRRLENGHWKAGQQTLTTPELLEILKREPERLSPNALLRPLFQDCLLPTAAYIGGPAEVAYFAQSEVLYRRILGRVTPVLPRFSCTLLPPALATLLARHELTLPDLIEAGDLDALALRLGARAMPIEGKRKLSAAGNALDQELTDLTGYMEALNEDLGRSALVAASKMRHQMNRLRRLAASFELEREASLRRHAEALMLVLYPDGHPQERVLAGVWFLAQAGDPLELIARLVTAAADTCPGHTLLKL